MAIRGSDLSEQEMMDHPQAGNGVAGGALIAAPYAAPAPLAGSYGAKGPELVNGGFNQVWLFHCLRRRWLMALSLGALVGAVTAGLLMWAFPEVSLVTAYLKVKSGSAEDMFDERGRNKSPQEMEKQAQNHLALLRAPMVLDAAWQQRDIVELDAVRAHKGQELLWLTEELRVSFPGDGEILEVKYEGKEDPEQMRKVVDAVVKAYQEKVLYTDRIAAEATQTDLDFVLTEIKTKYSSLLAELTKKAKDAGLYTEEIEIPKIRDEIRLLENLRVAAQQEKIDLAVFRASALQNSQNQTAIEAMVQQELNADQMIGSYKSQIFNAQQALSAQQAVGRNRASNSVNRLNAQIQQLEAQLEHYRSQAAKQVRDRLAKMPNEGLRAAIAEFNIRWESAAKNETDYTAQIEKLEADLLTKGQRDPEIDILERDIETERQIAADLEKRLRRTKAIDQAHKLRPGEVSEFDKVTVMQDASAVPAVNRIERFSIAGIGGLAALTLTCYSIALLEFRHRRLNGPTDMDEGLGVRVLGVLPPTSLKTLAGSSIVATQVAEAIDNVRATLMHDSTSRASQVVMVTSAGSQEGSTVVAASLALSLSRAGRRTLLVDGDLRSPDLHKLFGVEIEGGFSEVLRSEIDLDDAVRPTNNDKLYLLAAGVCDADAVHALATDQPQVIFDKLREQFDFVVIDAPPVLGISDSLSLGQHADGAILTVLRDHSEVREVYQASEMLKRMGIRVIGSVVNGVPVKVDRRVVRLHQATAKRQLQLPAKVDPKVEA